MPVRSQHRWPPQPSPEMACAAPPQPSAIGSAGELFSVRACFCGSDLRRSTSGWDGRSRTEGVGGEAVAQWTCAEGVAGALRARVVGRCSRARALAPLHQTHILRLWLRDNAYDARISTFSRATSLGAGPTCWSTPQTRRCAAAQDAPAPGTSRASATSTQPVCVRVVSCELPSTPQPNRLKMFQQCIKWVDHVCSRNANASDLSKPPWT